MTKVMVTGGSGLLGGALITRLVGDGNEVIALARSDEAAAKVRELGATPARGDILDPAALRDAMQGARYVYNVAGINTMCPRDRDQMLHVNVEGAAIVARAAIDAGVERLIHTSSAAALGEAHGTVGHEDSPHRGSYISVYEESKHRSEAAVMDAAAGSSLEVVHVNPASVQGPGRATGTGKLMIAYLDGRLKYFVDTTISIVDIEDTITGHVLAAEKGEHGRRYVLCGAALPVADAFAVASEVAGVTSRPRVLPAPIAIAAATVVEAGAAIARKDA
ncbi:MAG TPA: SDR family NAD(P)-dependent oxidoreductase, partial [Baekduia sp.]|nr:SDR family NAD(P)-dependent oxidoreductase [Baekduia sp.]